MMKSEAEEDIFLDEGEGVEQLENPGSISIASEPFPDPSEDEEEEGKKPDLTKAGSFWKKSDEELRIEEEIKAEDERIKLLIGKANVAKLKAFGYVIVKKIQEVPKTEIKHGDQGPA